MRYRFRTLARERLRNRRFDPDAARAWHARVREQNRTHRAWDASGLAIPFLLVLHERQDMRAAFSMAETFRDAGFIVRADGYTGIAVTGEPCLAIAFMLMAADAGILCEEFETFLDVGVDARSTLRDEDRDLVLRSLAKTLGSIKSVRPVRRRTARLRRRNPGLAGAAAR